MSDEIFRKVAIERLSSPEQLDKLIEITNPKGWFALISIILIITSFIVWSIFGSIPKKIRGQGILIKSGGVLRIVSTSQGQIRDLQVNTGDTIIKGQVIARIAQPELLEELRFAMLKFKEKEEKYDIAKSEGISEEARKKLESINKNRDSLIESIGFAKNKVSWLLDKIKSQEKLLKDGLITKEKLIDSGYELNNTKENIRKYEVQLKDLSAEEAQIKKNNNDRLERLKREYDESEQTVRLLESKRDLATKVYSSYTGIVISIESNEGDIVNIGSPIVSLELTGKEIKELEVVFYLNPLDGKKVAPGMDINISPSTVKREDHGFLIGKVIHVSEFPATFQSMMHIMSNEQLVKTLTNQGSPIEAYADLIPDENRPNGYRWSSKKGADINLQTGTLCDVEVIIERKSPVELVIPNIKTVSSLAN